MVWEGLQAPAVGTPDPTPVDAPLKRSTTPPEPVVSNAQPTAPAPVPAQAAPSIVAESEPVPMDATAAALAAPAELAEEALDYGGDEVEPELPAPREAKQRRPGAPPQASQVLDHSPVLADASGALVAACSIIVSNKAFFASDSRRMTPVSSSTATV